MSGSAVDFPSDQFGEGPLLAHPAHSAYVRFLALSVRAALTGKDSKGS
jgi:hypothetical protein